MLSIEETTPYENYEGAICVRLSYLLSHSSKHPVNVYIHPDSVQLITYSNYKKRCRRHKDFRLKEGRGAGNEALINWEALTTEHKNILIQRFGNPQQAKNPLEQFYKRDGAAYTHYCNYSFAPGEYLKTEQIERYTTNASVLNALAALKTFRETLRKSKGGNNRKIWDTLIADLKDFNNYLQAKHNTVHTLPTHASKLRPKFNEYFKQDEPALRYDTLIDGRNKNSNRAIVTPLMIQLWADLYAGIKGQKPNHIEVARMYNDFLEGRLTIADGDGVAYNPADEDFRAVNEKTVYNYQNLWENKIATHKKRSGDRQVYKQIYEPFHKLKQPQWAGSIISVDDRQPPFKTKETEDRIWFYNGIDLGSEAFTCWVYGRSKKGIILEFYRQMARNYNYWNKPLPHQLEGELSLNSELQETILKNGNMFQVVTIAPNSARSKRIESYYRPLRYGIEKKREGWLARPHARDEANQKGPGADMLLPEKEIITSCLQDIQTWNNTLHSNQQLHPGKTRWDVFMDKQHPNLEPTNWAGILPYLGYKTPTSMHAGRIILQNKHRVVGINGQVALGDTLISIMRQIEGKDVTVYWLDGLQGEVIKALVYGPDGRMVCELLGDLEYNRAVLEQTEEDLRNRELTDAYADTVRDFARSKARQIQPINILYNTKTKEGRFVMPGLQTYTPRETPAETMPALPEEKDLLTVPVDRNQFRRSIRENY